MQAIAKLSVRMSIAGMGIALFCNLAFATQSDCEAIATKNFPSEEELGDRLYAYHITDYLPQNGVLKAVTQDRYRFLITTHFSLGEPVADHNGGKWSERKYGIMVPIKFLRAQLLNLEPQDTFILGSLQLPKEAILFVPHADTSDLSGFKGTVIRYEEGRKIKEVMMAETTARKGIELRAQHQGEAGAPVLWNGVDINSPSSKPQFFKSFLNPNQNAGHHDTPVGVIDLTFVDYFYMWLLNGKFTNPYTQPITFSTQDFRDKLNILGDALEELDRIVTSMTLTSYTLNEYRASRAELSGYINLIEAEYKLRGDRNLSFFYSSAELHAQLMRARTQPAKVQEIIAANPALLTTPPEAKISKKSPQDVWNIFRFADLATLQRRMIEFFPNPTPETSASIHHYLARRAFTLLSKGRMDPQLASEALLHHLPLANDKDSLITTIVWGITPEKVNAHQREVFRRPDILKMLAHYDSFKTYFDEPDHWANRFITGFMTALDLQPEQLK